MNQQTPQYGSMSRQKKMTGIVKVLISIFIIAVCVGIGFGINVIVHDANKKHSNHTRSPQASHERYQTKLFDWLHIYLNKIITDIINAHPKKSINYVLDDVSAHIASKSTPKSKPKAPKPKASKPKASKPKAPKSKPDTGGGERGGKAHDSSSDAPPKGDAKLKDITEEMISKHNQYRHKNQYENGSAAKLASDPDLVKKAKDWIQFLHDNKWQGQGEPHPEKIEMSAARNGNVESVDQKWCEKYAGTASNCPSDITSWKRGCSRLFVGSSGGVCANNLTCGRLGQNVAWAGAAGNAKTAFNAWADEGKTCPEENPMKCPGKAGHYTQIVWKHASKMGCAQGKLSNGDDIIVCNYDQGNITGAKKCNLPTHFVQL